MPKKIQKALIKREEPVVIEVDPHELRSQIVVPRIQYRIVASFTNEVVFTGMVMPMPKVLMFFLTHPELLVVAKIIDETSHRTECTLSIKDFSISAKMAYAKISAAMHSLKRMGLMLEASAGTRRAGKNRKLNYEAIQHLNDLVEGEDPGIYSRIRRATRKRNIMGLTKEDVRGAYDNYVLEPGHDPEEEEEYD